LPANLLRVSIHGIPQTAVAARDKGCYVAPDDLRFRHRPELIALPAAYLRHQLASITLISTSVSPYSSRTCAGTAIGMQLMAYRSEQLRE
jgi:hypothetical protein